MMKSKLYRGVCGLALAGLMAIALGACGDDDKDAGEELCDKVAAKVKECNLQISTPDCVDTPEGRCAANCFNKASCSEFTDPESNFAKCFGGCQSGGGDGG